MTMQLLETRPINVFLVDDHKTVLWGLERLVQSAAPQMNVVGKAGSCAELLQALATAQPDIILLDLDLGGTSSLDSLAEIERNTTARVLILTGSSDPSVHQNAVVRGARGVVHKQVSAEVLLHAIDRVHNGEIWLDRALLGRAMTELARGVRPHPAAVKIASLTPKERQIVTVIVDEKSARLKVVADKLHTSEHTLRNHLSTIYSKLEVDGRMGLYLFASTHLPRC